MPRPSPLKRLRRICLALPDTKETLTWGSPHFRVANKIFCGLGEEKGRLSLGFKLEMEHADAVVQDPRFRRAAYVGKYGWVSVDAAAVEDWGEIEMLIRESYGLIAPKTSVAKLAARTTSTIPSSRARRRKPGAKRSTRPS